MAKHDRQKDDWYPTPFKATEKLLRKEDFDKTVWEPAAGDGAISVVLEDNGYKTISSDLNDYGFCDSGVDFLMETERKADSLVTNPPYKLADEFVKHAIYLGVQKHAWLLRLSFLEGVKRHYSIFSVNPPSIVYVFSQRLTIWRGDYIDSNTPVYGSGTTAYAWFVWDADDDSGTTQVTWI